MNRRALIRAVAPATVGVLAGSKSWAAKCETPCTPPRPTPRWIETQTTASLRWHIVPLVKTASEARSLDAIAPVKWNLAAQYNYSLGNAYSQLGNLHMMDMFAVRNQTVLARAFGAKPVQIILDRGFHAILAKSAEGMQQVHYKQMGTPCCSTSPAVMWEMKCHEFWTMVAVVMGVGAAIMSQIEIPEDDPNAAFESFLKWGAPLYDLMSNFLC